MPDARSSNPTQVMQCMEVWGGNALVNNSVSMAGLDAWVYSKPFESGQAGGDVHYVSSCATGRITRLLLADVSGHGESVRNTAGVLRDLMRRFVNHLDQRTFVRSMNKKFTALSEDGCFATAVVLTFFGPTNHLTVCNAGHPTPLFYRARTGAWSLLERKDSELEGISNIPLGIEESCNYEQVGVQMSVDDLVLCYSDSLIESRDHSGRMLGEPGLLEIVQEISAGDPASVAVELIKRVSDRAPENLTNDDVTILLFRVSGSGTPARFRDKFLAPFRVAGGILKSLLPRGGPAPLPEMSLANIGGAISNRFNRRHGK